MTSPLESIGTGKMMMASGAFNVAARFGIPRFSGTPY
jgi:hypothetical protein